MDATKGMFAVATSVVLAVMYVVRGRRRKEDAAKILRDSLPIWIPLLMGLILLFPRLLAAWLAGLLVVAGTLLWSAVRSPNK
jgi:hypothetical protein